jgi:hypothetical protein
MRFIASKDSGIGSDVLYFDVLGTSVIVLNSFKAAQDLLEHRSGIYSSRRVIDSSASVVILINELHRISLMMMGNMYETYPSQVHRILT